MLVRKNNGDRGAGIGERESGSGNRGAGIGNRESGIGDKRAREQGSKGAREQGGRECGECGECGGNYYLTSLFPMPNAPCPMPNNVRLSVVELQSQIDPDFR
ncbi:hypothetical protein BLD44_004085 [Mastigocladus laminosus UU774]|nr:hypothetical protein BLD44_004085 [Mastigocladus laminosus UU774]